MTPERWQQVDKVLHSALERPESQQTDFLEAACSGDEALRKEVESLLGFHRRATRFLETPAREAALRALVEEESGPFAADDFDQPLAGRMISHYRVLKIIGGGGMGVVYQAEDTDLARIVALKFLPPALGQSATALEQFKRKADAASSLNHPNICTIHGIEQYEGQPYIAMEFLEGQTLKQRLVREHLRDDSSEPARRKGIPLATEEILRFALQIAGALEAAHQKGIFHGAIKPANIFITSRGQAKILDFGLAELIASSRLPPPFHAILEVATGAVAGPATSTDAGIPPSHSSAMGTVAYMSPEQARGEEIDARTDLFGFGTVLYELATGRQAFSGDTTSLITDAILNRTPASPTELNQDLPLELAGIITKALQRDRAARFQTAAEMQAELKLLQATLTEI